jgi:hypothetical protein
MVTNVNYKCKQNDSDINKNKISKYMNTTHSIVRAYSNIENIHSIEEQRNKTMADPKYIQWVKNLKVSQLYTSRELIENANEMMRDYRWNR